MKKIIVLLAALSSTLASASPSCFSSVVNHYRPSEAGRACHDVSDLCFEDMQTNHYGPMESANKCRTVSTTCFRDMRGNDNVGPGRAANACRNVDEDCYVNQRRYFNYVQDIAAACTLVVPIVPGMKNGPNVKEPASPSTQTIH